MHFDAESHGGWHPLSRVLRAAIQDLLDHERRSKRYEPTEGHTAMAIYAVYDTACTMTIEESEHVCAAAPQEHVGEK